MATTRTLRATRLTRETLQRLANTGSVTMQERVLDLAERDGARPWDAAKELRALQSALPANHGLSRRDLDAIVEWKARGKMGMDEDETELQRRAEEAKRLVTASSGRGRGASSPAASA